MDNCEYPEFTGSQEKVQNSPLNHLSVCRLHHLRYKLHRWKPFYFTFICVVLVLSFTSSQASTKILSPLFPSASFSVLHLKSLSIPLKNSALESHWILKVSAELGSHTFLSHPLIHVRRTKPPSPPKKIKKMYKVKTENQPFNVRWSLLKILIRAVFGKQFWEWNPDWNVFSKEWNGNCWV